MSFNTVGLRERRSSLFEKKEISCKITKQNTHPSDIHAAAPATFHLEGYTLTPLRQRSLWSRLDVFPFILLYGTCIWLEQQTLILSTRLNHFLLPLALLLHLSVAIWQQWRVPIKARVGYMVESDSDKWTHVLVQATGGDAGLVPVGRLERGVVVTSFQNVVFRFDDNALFENLWNVTTQNTQVSSFHRLHYPIDFLIDFYTTWKGHASLESLQQSENMYGTNTTLLELPSFVSLLKQQLLAPFFLFQLFCVVLWSLDEYWYYAIFTLFALLMFEGTVAYNRRASVERLRKSTRVAQRLYCYRMKTWMVVSSQEVVPGDLVSLSSDNHNHVPADVLLLQGTAVVDEALLTGESVPQMKSPIDEMASPTSVLHVEEFKSCILFGGTNLVSHSCRKEMNTSGIPCPPDQGVVGFTLKTGFETAQGSLLRTMAHSSTKAADGIHTRDTFVFVGLLLVCAIASAMAVLLEGWKDDTRNPFRLVLHVIIIITSVVPPELPMELSLAVTNSVADLMKRCRVYCTEPFRIPWAGQVDTCCFDKTGTLTSDEMQFKGVRLLSNDTNHGEELLHPLTDIVPWDTVRVMAGCHSLAWNPRRTGERSNSPVIGDPMEAAVLQDSVYQVERNDTVVFDSKDKSSTNGFPQTIQIQHRFAFSSRLKRMTVLVTEDESRTVWALTKGAPETIQSLLKSIPDDYEQVYTHYMGCGQRVLAMGYRTFDKMNVSQLKDKGREYVEQDFVFAGFLVLDCPLKADTKSVISELRKSNHRCVMITGDAVLTAAEVARQVGIIRKKTKVTYELQEKDASATDASKMQTSGHALSGFEFVPLTVRKSSKSTTTSIPASDRKLIQELIESNEASFCVTGSVLTKVAISAVKASPEAVSKSSVPPKDEKTMLFGPAAQEVLKELVPSISVFARHAPRQKEAVIAAFNLSGRHTLMCGDGTNDVGALKRAHVGISIISAPEIEAKTRKATAKLQKKKKQRASTFEASLRQLQEAQDELDQVELGDASVASPFTSRAMSIKCCKDVLQQGRCTLVTMLQIYKILGVNCLVNALVLTKLHMHGVKQGDRQLTILGLAVAALFLFVTRGKPLPTLSPDRPPSSVLCAQAILSITAQFAVHYCAIILATESAFAFVDPYDPSMIPDGAFNANVLNTCTFLVTMVATVNTFFVNYKGRPYMQDFRENTMLLRGVQICHAVIWICALEVFPPLNDLLQLSPFPPTDMSAIAQDDDWVASLEQAGGLTQLVRSLGFPTFMCLLMAADTAIAYGAEKAVARMFS
jgi:cation-transporting ATPase 13A1